LWNVNDVRLCRNDSDEGGRNNDALLGRALENSIVERFSAKTLNRLSNGWFLCHVSLPKRCRPFRMLSHHVEDLRIMGDRFNTHVPILILDQILIQPATQQLRRL